MKWKISRDRFVGGFVSLLLWYMFFPVDLVTKTVLYRRKLIQKESFTNYWQNPIWSYLASILGILIALLSYGARLAFNIYTDEEFVFLLLFILGIVFSSLNLGEEEEYEGNLKEFSYKFHGILSILLGLLWGFSTIMLSAWLINYINQIKG